MTEPNCTLAHLRELLATFRVSANSAWNILEEARGGGPSDLAGLLAYLGSRPAYAGGDPTTKLDILRESLLESIAAGREVAAALGFDLSAAADGGPPPSG